MIGIIIGIMFLIASASQTRKLLQTKNGDSISLLTYLLTNTAVFVSIIVAYMDGSVNLIISNGLSFSLLFTNLILIIKYRYYG